jgi:amidohydrolase
MKTLLFDDFKNKAEEIQSFLISIRRFLHRNPEVSWNELRTKAYLMAMAQSNGLVITKEFDGINGFYIDLGPDTEFRTAWRADIDALPITDKKTTSYASAFSNAAHLCGHDVHATVALGIAILLKDAPLKKGIRIFFQPAEESSPSGAPRLIEQGVLTQVDKVYGMHCDPNQESGWLSINAGSETASYDGIHLNLFSEAPNHSARPHTGKDLIWIVTSLLQQWYSIAGRITDSRDPAVLTISTLNAGEAINVMPDSLSLSGTLRCVTEENRNKLKNFMLESVTQLEGLYGIRAELKFDEGAPSVLNNAALAEHANRKLAEFVQLQATRQSMGGEDFGWYSQLKPSLFVRVGTKNSPETSYPLHHNCFDVDESVIGPTCALMAYLIASE